MIPRIPLSRQKSFFLKMLSRIIAAYLLFFLLYPQDASALPSWVHTRRQAALLMDGYSGNILYSYNIHRLIYPASLVKMMTAYLVFEAIDSGRLKPQQRLKVSAHAASMEPTNLKLRKGDQITVRDALRGMIVKSANDCAVVLAEALAPSEKEFAKRMNSKARELGLRITTFYNASGLPHPYQISTACEMGRLGLALLQHYPHHYSRFQVPSFFHKGERYRSTNKLLGTMSIDGIKTGFTRSSGCNIVASAGRGFAERYIVVVIGTSTGKERSHVVLHLLKTAFESPQKIGKLSPVLFSQNKKITHTKKIIRKKRRPQKGRFLRTATARSSRKVKRTTFRVKKKARPKKTRRKQPQKKRRDPLQGRSLKKTSQPRKGVKKKQLRHVTRKK